MAYAISDCTQFRRLLLLAQSRGDVITRRTDDARKESIWVACCAVATQRRIPILKSPRVSSDDKMTGYVQKDGINMIHR